MPKRAKPTPPAPVDSLAAFEKTLKVALDLAAKDPDLLPGAHEHEGNPRALAPRVPETADWVNKQIDNARAAADRWKAGALRPKKDPIAEAKKAKGKWKNKMEAAIRDDAYARGLDAVDEDAMIATIEATPASAFSEGIERRRQKITGKVERLRGNVLALANTLDAMPVDTDQQREAKMIAARRGMIEVGKKMKGR